MVVVVAVVVVVVVVAAAEEVEVPHGEPSWSLRLHPDSRPLHYCFQPKHPIDGYPNVHLSVGSAAAAAVVVQAGV